MHDLRGSWDPRLSNLVGTMLCRVLFSRACRQCVYKNHLLEILFETSHSNKFLGIPISATLLERCSPETSFPELAHNVFTKNHLLEILFVNKHLNEFNDWIKPVFALFWAISSILCYLRHFVRIRLIQSISAQGCAKRALFARFPSCMLEKIFNADREVCKEVLHTKKCMICAVLKCKEPLGIPISEFLLERCPQESSFPELADNVFTKIIS